MSSDISDIGLTAKPFFGARIRLGRVETSGAESCVLGKRIRQPDRALDDGVFVEWTWDGRRLVVVNDRFGLYPLFYSCADNEIWVSPALTGVLRGNSKRALNLPALAIFYRLGHFIGEDTAFTDVHFLPPNSTLTWQDGKVTIDRRTEVPPPPASFSRGFDESVEEYIHLFGRSMSKRLPEDARFTVPISGGRDSRHILLELNKQGNRPRSCMTVKYRPPATNEDTRIARLLTDALGIEHEELDKPASFFQAVLTDIHLTNFCGGGHGWILPVAEHLRGRVGTMYDGLAGSVLSGGFMLGDAKLALFRDRKFEDLALLILQENKQEQVNRNLLTASLYDGMPMGIAIERLVVELKRHADVPNPVLSFVFWNRTRRCVASIPFAILADIPVVHCPYLDHDLFDFLLTVDASMVAGNRLHDETIKRAYPEYAGIPFEDAGLKATFTKQDRAYYRDSRKEFLAYLAARGRAPGASVKLPYLYSKILLDVARYEVSSPWYMRTALYAIELDALRGIR